MIKMQSNKYFQKYVELVLYFGIRNINYICLQFLKLHASDIFKLSVYIFFSAI